MKKTINSLIILVLAFSGLGTTSASAAKTYTLKFGVASYNWHSLADNEAEANRTSECYAGQYSKLSAGAILKVTNENGKLLAIGKTAWKITEVTDQGEDYGSVRYQGTCILYTTIKKLPKAQIYQLNLGSVDAGAYTFQEMVADKWELLLSYN